MKSQLYEEEVILSKEEITLLLNIIDIHHNLVSIFDSIYTTVDNKNHFLNKTEKKMHNLIKNLHFKCINEFKLLLDNEAKQFNIAIHYNLKHLFNIHLIYYPPSLGNRLVYKIKSYEIPPNEITDWLISSTEKYHLEEKIKSIAINETIIKI